MGALYRSLHRSTSLTLWNFHLALLVVTVNAVAVMLPFVAEQAQLNVSNNRPGHTSHPYKQNELLVKLREGVVVTNSKALAAKLGVPRGKNFRAPSNRGQTTVS